jgi:hypothetical protein
LPFALKTLIEQLKPLVLMHELGHALGAEHGGDGLMSTPYSRLKQQCVDRYTILQVATHERMAAGDLNYCVVP